MKTKIFSVAVALAFVFSACNKDLPDASEVSEGGVKAKAVSGLVWNGASDKAVAADIDAVANDTRKNASGAKITSNAHSADFPGIYFIWDSKQKDNGYLKVDAAVFDKYSGFTLTSKESNTYWDFAISVQDGQEQTADNCYVFFIPRAQNNKNINMVFVSDYVEKVEQVVVNLGFIGYYLFEGEVFSTSIHWQNLEKDGDCIDWDAVDAAYDAWVAQGGLVPDRTLWQTSGFASFTFEDYAGLCFGDFNIGQLESYYKAYYVDPGYVLPEEDCATKIEVSGLNAARQLADEFMAGDYCEAAKTWVGHKHFELYAIKCDEPLDVIIKKVSDIKIEANIAYALTLCDVKFNVGFYTDNSCSQASKFLDYKITVKAGDYIDFEALRAAYLAENFTFPAANTWIVAGGGLHFAEGTLLTEALLAKMVEQSHNYTANRHDLDIVLQPRCEKAEKFNLTFYTPCGDKWDTGILLTLQVEKGGVPDWDAIVSAYPGYDFDEIGIQNDSGFTIYFGDAIPEERVNMVDSKGIPGYTGNWYAIRDIATVLAPECQE